MSSQSQSAMHGGPYPPRNASLGGRPTNLPDIPVTAVFMAIYISLAATHMTIFQINRRRGHKFIMSGLMFGFCMSRILTTTLRIVWSQYPESIRIGIAAQIFVAAGVVLLYVINVIFAQRILRASHPEIGWHPITGWIFKGVYIMIIVFLIMLITATCLMFYTHDPSKLKTFHRLQLAGQTYYSLIATLPIPLVMISIALRKSRGTPVDKFGSGRHRTKIAVLVLGAAVLALGSLFRTITNYFTPRPISDPAWYQSKACFYIFNFTCEVTVVLLYALVRVDRRFYVPNGARGTYKHDPSNQHDAIQQPTMGADQAAEKDLHDDTTPEENGRFHIDDEEDIFDGAEEQAKPRDLESARV